MWARLFFFFSSQNQKRKVMTSMYLRVCVHTCIFYMCTGLARGAVCLCVCARVCELLFVFLLFCVRAAAPVCVCFSGSVVPLAQHSLQQQQQQKDHYDSVSIVWQFQECLAFCQAFICGRTHTADRQALNIL